MTGMGCRTDVGLDPDRWTKETARPEAQREQDASALRARARSRPGWSSRSPRQYRGDGCVTGGGSSASGRDLEHLCFRGLWPTPRRHSPCEQPASSRRPSRDACSDPRARHRAGLRRRPLRRRVRRDRGGRLDERGRGARARARTRDRDGRGGRDDPGSMAAILGLEDEVVETLCRKILGVWPANYNCPARSSSPARTTLSTSAASGRRRRGRAAPSS